MVSWLQKLRDAEAEDTSTLPTSFGWYETDGQNAGFAYGGQVFLNDGTERHAESGDPEVQRIYRPRGELAAWLRACRLITDQHRPELDTVVATAFAAPLLQMIGAGGACVACCGPSGSGKSTALEVAASVWGNPKKTIDTHTARTERGLVGKLGILRHLPLYIDGEGMFEVTKSMLTQGNTGARWASNQQMQVVNEFQTIMTIASNASFWKYVKDGAGLYRVFEIAVEKPRPKAQGQLTILEAEAIKGELLSNYGMMGLAYAKLLAHDPVSAKARVLGWMEYFEHKCEATQPERLWLAVAATIMAGATHAKTLGCAFNLDRLRDFQVYQITTLRARLVAAPPDDPPVDLKVAEHLNAFLEHFRPRSVWSHRMIPLSRGGPAPKDLNLRIIKVPEKTRIAQGAHVHYCLEQRLIIFRADTFRNFLHGRRVILEAAVRHGLTKSFGAEGVLSTLLKGTVYAHSAKARLVVIPVPPGSPLERFLFAPQGFEEAVQEPGQT